MYRPWILSPGPQEESLKPREKPEEKVPLRENPQVKVC